MKILIGITGGISAYKIADLASLLTKQGHEVQCILTENAKKFVSPLVLETLTGNSISDSLWNEGTEHIRLARWPDVFMIAPATANSIAKISLGLADDLLSTVALATDWSQVRIVFAPAMNTKMYQQEVTQDHLKVLERRGAQILPPSVGVLACKEEGEGKLPDTETLAGAILGYKTLDQSTWFQNQRILITGGPTISRIDAVRYLTNPSTGKMACALADAAYRLGAEITLVLGKDKGVVLPTTPEQARFRILRVETAQEMRDLALAHLPKVTGVIACAAVMDYEVDSPSTNKLKRTEETATLLLKSAPDVLKTLKQNADPQTWFFGFAAETDSIEANANAKLAYKEVDYLFVNTIASIGQTLPTGFGGETNAGSLLFRTTGSKKDFSVQDKERLAEKLLAEIEADQISREKMTNKGLYGSSLQH